MTATCPLLALEAGSRRSGVARARLVPSVRSLLRAWLLAVAGSGWLSWLCRHATLTPASIFTGPSLCVPVSPLYKDMVMLDSGPP